MMHFYWKFWTLKWKKYAQFVILKCNGFFLELYWSHLTEIQIYLLDYSLSFFIIFLFFNWSSGSKLLNSVLGRRRGLLYSYHRQCYCPYIRESIIACSQNVRCIIVSCWVIYVPWLHIPDFDLREQTWQICEDAVDRIRDQGQKPIPVNLVVSTKGWSHCVSAPDSLFRYLSIYCFI